MATKHETTTVTRKCRVDEHSPQTEVKLTIAWDSPADERAFATRGVVIAAQAMMRASGSIPTTLDVSVGELAKRERGGFALKPTAENAGRLMVKLSDAEYSKALIEMGMSAVDVKRLVAHRAQPPVGAAARVEATKPGPVTITKPAKPAPSAPTAPKRSK